jgi:hypothetical protein
VKRNGFAQVGLIAVLALGAAATAQAGAVGFTFTPPAGWIDVSRGAPAAQRQKVPPELLAKADNPAVAYVAVNPAHDDDGLTENMTAIVQTGVSPPLPTREALAEMVKGMEAQAVQQGATYHASKVELVKIGGVTSGRFVGEMKPATGPALSLVQYAIPGQRAYAALTFTTTPRKLAEREPIFEASAQATRGAVEPAAGGSLMPSSMIGILAGVAAALGSMLAIRAKGKRKAQAVAPAADLGPRSN